MNADEIANISIIIPIWREHDALFPLVRDLKSWPQVREVIVSLRWQLGKLGVIFLNNIEPNRGKQLNQGARIATGEWLLFQHADTELCREHVEALAALNGTDAVAGIPARSEHCTAIKASSCDANIF